jgi:hypothetical protein
MIKDYMIISMLVLIKMKEIEFVKFADMHVVLVKQMPITVLYVLIIPEKVFLLVDVLLELMKY